MSLTTASTLDCFTATFCLAYASYSTILLPKGLKPESSFTLCSWVPGNDADPAPPLHKAPNHHKPRNWEIQPQVSHPVPRHRVTSAMDRLFLLGLLLNNSGHGHSPLLSFPAPWTWPSGTPTAEFSASGQQQRSEQGKPRHRTSPERQVLYVDRRALLPLCGQCIDCWTQASKGKESFLTSWRHGKAH